MSLWRRIAAGSLALALAACAPEVRYRTTIEVDTPEGVKTGSSVWAWRIAKGGLDTAYSGQFRGEAIAVDLGERGMLFGLLSGRNAEGKPDPGAMTLLPERTFGDLGRGMRGERKLHRDRVSDVRDISRRVGSVAELDCSQTAATASCPFLVRFSNLGDPISVEAVNPNDLGYAFGNGVRLRRITIEITDDPVSTGIEQRLLWLPNQHGSLLKIRGRIPAAERPISGRLNDGDFWRRTNK